MTERRKKRILFFSPLAARNGAEMMLFHLLNNLDREQFEVAVFFNQDGDLVNDFRKKGYTVFVSPYRQQRLYFHYNRLRKKYLGRSAYDVFVEKCHRAFAADCWYLNTLKLSHLIPLAKSLQVPSIMHSHENKFQLAEFKKSEILDVLQADLLVACANWVSETYRELGMQRVETLYEMVDLSEIKVVDSRVTALRQKYGIGSEDFVWLMSGNTAYRKGIDFMPEIIQKVNRPNAKYLWVGPIPGDSMWFYTEKKLQQLGIRSFIHCGAQKEDYYNIFALANAFMLTSRFDSYPLVMTEAAAFGLPIAAIDSGGVKEFVTAGCGKVVRGHDIDALAEAMKDIMDGRMDIDRNKILARAQDFDAKKMSAEWQLLMNRFFADK